MCKCLKTGREEQRREGGREREKEREKDANILLRNFMYYHIEYINSSTCHGYIVLHYVQYVKTEDLIITDQLDFELQ